jgi:Loader and inhibitor of phage G40P
MNKDETAKLLMFVKANYNFAFKDIDEMTFKMMKDSWHAFFEDIPVEVMVKVVQKHILMGDDYLPKVKWLREEALKIMSPSSAPLSPEMAWEKGRKTVISFGRYNKDLGMERLRAVSLAIARAINAVGWERICNATDENIGLCKRDFILYYSETNHDEKQGYIMPTNILNRLKDMQPQKIEVENEPKQLPEV